jgi:hypothetical protein
MTGQLPIAMFRHGTSVRGGDHSGRFAEPLMLLISIDD